MTVSSLKVLYRITLQGAVYASYAISSLIFTSYIFVNDATALYLKKQNLQNQVGNLGFFAVTLSKVRGKKHARSLII